MIAASKRQLEDNRGSGGEEDVGGKRRGILEEAREARPTRIAPRARAATTTATTTATMSATMKEMKLPIARQKNVRSWTSIVRGHDSACKPLPLNCGLLLQCEDSISACHPDLLRVYQLFLIYYCLPWLQSFMYTSSLLL